MKRRIRVQPTNPFYTNEPAVNRSLLADAGMSPNPNLANSAPRMVDKKPGRLSGLANFTSKSKPPAGNAHISTPKLGTAAKVPAQGSLRMSGHSGAHRLGAPKPLKMKF